MNGKLSRMMKDESGITALETAIILIAFVVVAAIFAFTILSTGTFLTERSKESAYAGLQEVRGSMELRGGVVLTTTSGTSTAERVLFTVATVAGGQPVNLTYTATQQVVDVTYRDKDQSVDLNNVGGNSKWSVQWLVAKQNPPDNILEPGEQAQIVVDLATAGLNTPLGSDKTFVIEVKPPQGGVLNIERTTPSRIDPVTDLH